MEQVQLMPLLVQGFALTQAAISSVSRDQFTLTKNRGDITSVDILAARTGALLANTSVQIGGTSIIENEILTASEFDAFPSVYQFPEGVYRGGQTMNTVLDNSSNPVQTSDAFIHVFHENRYDNPEMFERLDTPFLGLKQKTYAQSVIAGAKNVTQSAILPKNQGQIIAVQIIGDAISSTFSTYLLSTISLRVNGVQVIIDASLGLGIPSCSRPYLILPIQIDPASTIDITISNNGTASLVAGVRFFFDSIHAEPLNMC